jgi:hypothetical protein
MTWLTLAVLAFTALAASTTSASVQSASAQPAPVDRGERAVVHAAKVSDGAVRLDGQPDEAAWDRVAPANSFTQNEPLHGAPATFDTSVRVLFDETHLYVSAVLRDTLGRAGVRVPALQRDFDYDASDVFSLILDPFGDERNAFVFQVNPYGAQRDLQVREGITFRTCFDFQWRRLSAS